MILNGAIGSKLISHMSMFSNNGDDDFKIFPAVPTKYTVYNIYSGDLAKNMYGYPVLNGGMYPRLCNIIGESATGKTSFMIGSVASAIDNIRKRFGDGYSELFFFDCEKNTPTNRLLNLSNWSPADFITKCNYSNKDLTLLSLANLIIKIANEKAKFRKDYLLPSGLMDIDGREVQFLAPTYICVDSVAAVNPEGVESLIETGKDGEVKDLDALANNTEAMRDAKAWTIFVRKIKPYLDMGNVGLYCINHKTKETKMSMFEKETRYLPFLGMGEKLKGGKEFIFQSYNILDFQSGEKYDERNPVYGNDISGFSTRCSFVKNKGNIEGAKFPMVFDQFKGYIPEISDMEYLWQSKFGIDGVSKITLDVLPEISFTRKTLLKTIEEFPQLGRALQFTAKFHASNKMLWRTEPASLKDFGTNVPLEQRLSILYNFTTPYGKEANTEGFREFSRIAHENQKYYTFGGFNKDRYANVTSSNQNIENAVDNYTYCNSSPISPYDADLGNAHVYDGKYVIMKSDIPTSENIKK